MIAPLTIKDLNCSTCSLSHCPLFAVPGHKPSDSNVHNMITTAILKVGCCMHPLALQVLAAPAIVEMHKRTEIAMKAPDAFAQGYKNAVEETKSLLRGDH